MTRSKMISWTAIVALFVFASGCAVQQSWFDGSIASRRNASLKGEIKEALAYYETEAKRVEKDAAASSFPQQYWGVAINSYLQAASAARSTGQLQKAIIYGEKALEIAQRTQASVIDSGDARTLSPPPLPELRAISNLIITYNSVRDFDKARTLRDRGIALLKENRAGHPNIRLSLETGLYRDLGIDLGRRGEYEQAIETLSQAVYLQRTHANAASVVPLN